MGIPGFWLFIVSEVLLAVLLLITIPYLRYPAGKAFFVLVFSALVWVIMYTLELLSPTLALKILFMRIEYIGIIILPLSLFIMAVINTHQKIITPVWMLLGAMALMFFITVWVIPYPNAFWSFIDPPIPQGVGFVNVRTYGPMFYYLFIPYSQGLMSVSIIILVRKLNRDTMYYWRQVALFSLGMLLPAGINFVYVIGFSPVEHINYATASMGVSSLIIGYTLLRYRFLDYLPVTRDIVIEAMSDGILVFDTLGNLLDANSSAERMLGIQDLIGGKIERILPSEIMGKVTPYIEKKLKSSFIMEQREKFFEYQFTPLEGNSGYQSGYLLSIRDISEKERYHREVLRISRLDPLTEVLNRRSLFEEIERKLTSVSQGKGGLSLIMVDIDDFKQVNDTWGHHVGDRAIDRLKGVLLEAAGSKHMVGRYGGDEFILLCIDISEKETVKLAQSVLDQVSRLPAAEGDVRFLISAGVSSSDSMNACELSSDSLFSQADEMLYDAKRGGKNQVCSPSKYERQ